MWSIQGDGSQLSTKDSYLVVANHQTWLDILVLGYVFSGKTPSIRFFMKRELLWMLPIIGLACLAIGYPFLRRYSRQDIRKNPHLKNKDIETTQAACQKFKEFPTSIVNFVEGTRRKASANAQSSFKNLLNPKAGGVAMVINELHQELSGILNVTIHYSKPVSFFEYFRGDACVITVCYELLPITEDLIGDYYNDREFRRHFQAWLKKIWLQKDEQLNQLKNSDDVTTIIHHYS